MLKQKDFRANALMPVDNEHGGARRNCPPPWNGDRVIRSRRCRCFENLYRGDLTSPPSAQREGSSTELHNWISRNYNSFRELDLGLILTTVIKFANVYTGNIDVSFRLISPRRQAILGCARQSGTTDRKAAIAAYKGAQKPSRELFLDPQQGLGPAKGGGAPNLRGDPEPDLVSRCARGSHNFRSLQTAWTAHGPTIVFRRMRGGWK